MTIRRPGGLAGPLVVLVVVCLVLVPVAAVAIWAAQPDGQWGMAAISRILRQRRSWRLVAVTAGQAAASALVTVVTGVVTATGLSRYRFKGRAALRTLVMVPFVLPSVVIGAAFATIFGPQGLLDARGTWWLIVAAHTSFNLAVVTRTVGAAMAGMDPDRESAARMLGRSPLQAFVEVVIPEVLPAIASSAVVVFLYSFTSFGVIVMLGGGSVTTMEVEIWTRATRQFDLSGAGVLAMVQFSCVLVTVWLHSRITMRWGSGTTSTVRDNSRRVGSAGSRGLVAFAAAAVLVLAGAPVVALVERSLRVGQGYGLQNWLHLGSVLDGTGLQVSALTAIFNSLLNAGLATLLVLLIAVPATRYMSGAPGGFTEKLVLVPLGVSATTIGLGFLLVAGRLPFDIRSSAFLVPVAQVLVSLPLVVRVLLPAVRATPGSFSDAAAVLGCGPKARFLRVELPLVRLAIAAGAGLGFVSCLGEFGATVFLARSDRATMPILIERLMSRPGQAGFGQAMVLSVMMIIVCGAALMLVERVARGERMLDVTF